MTDTGTLAIGSYLGESVDELIIPSEIGGAKVSQIDSLFSESDIVLQKVIIPNSVTTMGENAFESLGIEELVFEKNSSLTSIGKNAFYGNNIKSIDLQDLPLTTIGEFAFACNQIEKITLPKDQCSIGYHAFAGNNFKSLTINSKIKFTYELIGREGWGGIPTLERAEQSEPYIGYVVMPSDPLEEVIFENDRTEKISNYFTNAKNLKKVTLPRPLKTTYRGDPIRSLDCSYAFEGCISLKECNYSGISLSTAKDAKAIDPILSFYSSYGAFLGCPLDFNTQRILLEMGFTNKDF